MEHDQIRDLLNPYVVGVLADEEREIVERHLTAGCPACSQELKDLSLVAESLLDLANLDQPSEQLKKSVFARIEQTHTSAPETPQVRMASTSAEDHRATTLNLVKLAGVVAALAACMLLAFASWWYKSAVQQREQVAAESLEALRAMQSRIAQTETILDASRFSTIGLDLKPASDGPVNRILYDELSRELHLWIAAVAEMQNFDAVRILDSQGEVIAQEQLSGEAKYRYAVIPLVNLPPRGMLELGEFVGPIREESDDTRDFVANRRIEFSIPTDK